MTTTLQVIVTILEYFLQVLRLKQSDFKSEEEYNKVRDEILLEIEFDIRKLK